MQAEGRAAVTPPSGGASGSRYRARFFAIAAAVVAADQVTKLLVVRSIPEGDHVRVFDDWLVISHIRNSGAAFGTLRGFGGVLALAAIAGVAVFAFVVWRRPSPVVGMAAALVAGGAMGNLLDRIVRGTVVDFVDFRFWPAFNVADTAITIGALLLVLFGSRPGRG
jgi:signal peptidase II